MFSSSAYDKYKSYHNYAKSYITKIGLQKVDWFKSFMLIFMMKSFIKICQILVIHKRKVIQLIALC